jgi:signal transduction histidine kinase
VIGSATSSTRRPAGRRTFSLQPLLVALPALAVVPLLAFSLWLLNLVLQNAREEARRDLRQMVGTLAVAVDRELAGSVRELERIAEFPTIGPEGFEALHGYLGRLAQRNHGWTNLILVDPDGTIRVNAALPHGTPMPFKADLPHIAQVVASRAPVVSDIYVSRRTGEAAIGVAVPVLRDGEVRWVLTARLTPEVLSRFVGDRLYSTGAVAAIADRNLRIVARSREAERFFGHPVTDDLRTAVTASPANGIERLSTLDRMPVIAAWERLPSGWTLTVGLPLDVYDQPTMRSIPILVGVGLAVLGLGMLSSLLLARRISAAVDAVAVDARRMVAGEPVPSRPTSIRQFAVLFESLREAGRMQREKERARDQAVTALREADRRKDEFLAMLAHELRNPLAPLRNAMGLLARTAAQDAATASVVAMADRQVRQLTRLVDDLLDVSRITQGKIELHRAPVRICDAVREAVETLRPATDARDQQVTLRLPSISPVVDADALRLAQVLENLLSNASKYTDPGGAIRVDVDSDDDAVSIAVSDNGIGLPLGQEERIFELFTQVAGHAERAQGGLGIGLSLVRQLVELHGGSVSARSAGPGQGACFTVRLPRAVEGATVARDAPSVA